MKRILKLIICAAFVISLAGCGEKEPECEHKNTVTKYETSGLSIRKITTCKDCEKEIDKKTFDKLQYVYNKVLVDEKGIKCTLLDAEVDGWSTVTLHFEVEGTSKSKRNFSCTEMFLDGYDVTALMYCTDLAGNRKSLEDQWLSDLKGEDFLEKQDRKLEMEIEIINPDNYKTLLKKEVSVNLSEYAEIKEIGD